MYNGQCYSCIYNNNPAEACDVCIGLSTGTVGKLYRAKSCDLCQNATYCASNERVCSTLNLNQFVPNEELIGVVDMATLMKDPGSLPVETSVVEAGKVVETLGEKTLELPTATPVETISGQNIEAGGQTLSYAEAFEKVFGKQVGGSHYKTQNLPPGFPDVAAFCAVHGVKFPEGCVIKYAFRHEFKDGLKDILKGMEWLQFIALLRYKQYVEINCNFKVL